MRYEINVSTGNVVEFPDLPATEPTTEQIISDYVSAMELAYDKIARKKNYDTRYTCALRAGYAGPFQTEGQAFAMWMDQCNAYAYQELEKIKSGQRSTPNVEEFINEFPPAPW